MRLYTLPLFLLTLILKVRALNINIKTEYKNMVRMKHFWRSTGLCPTSDPGLRDRFLLSNDENLNLDLIGALPNNAINMIRIHWLLDLVHVKDANKPNRPVFDFESLDRLIDRLRRNNLNPIFELMGNPSNYFHNFKRQRKDWSELIKQIIRRYGDRYGQRYVNGWRFELTNEPDLKLYNNFNFTLENYLDYFRASESAVKSLAGPAGLFRDNKKVHFLCWGLLDYCNRNPCNLDMITFHRKGDGIGSQVVDRSLELIDLLTSKYQNLKGIPFGNNEADIHTGWIRPFEWRADVRYAALVLQVIIGHAKKLLIDREIPFELLSNDNAFLSFSPHYFTQRTLLARFQMNNTFPKHVQFFKKPVYSVMALLSLSAHDVKDIRYAPGENGFSYMVTSEKHRDAFLGVIANDEPGNGTDSFHFVTIRLKVSLRNSSLSGRSVGYIMDNLRTNPYKIWLNAGNPNFPSFHLRRNMRNAEGFKRLFIEDFKPHQTHVNLKLKEIFVPSVVYVGVCFEGAAEPGPVTGLRFEKIFTNEVLLLWSDVYVQSRCLLTYIVEFRTSKRHSFQRVNTIDSIFLSHHFDGHGPNGSLIGVVGEYRVAALDYWNRRGSFSEVLTVF